MANYYDSTDIVVFPSSNATDSGKVTAEENIITLVNRLKVNNFKLNSTDFGLSVSNGKLVITGGTANINGYLITTKTITVNSYPSVNGVYNVVLGLIYDSSKHVIGDINLQNQGVSIQFIEDPSDITYDMLSLGTMTYSSPNVTSCTTLATNLYPFSSDDVMINVDGELYNLTDYIPNFFVSRVKDDTKKGKLTFRNIGDSLDTIVIDPNSPYIEYRGSDTKYSRLSHTSLRFTDQIGTTSIDGTGNSIDIAVGQKHIKNSSNGIDINGSTSPVNISNSGSTITISNSNTKILMDYGNSLLSMSYGTTEYIKIANDIINLGLLSLRRSTNTITSDSDITIDPNVKFNDIYIRNGYSIDFINTQGTGNLMEMSASGIKISNTGSQISTLGGIVSTSNITSPTATNASYTNINKNTVVFNATSSSQTSKIEFRGSGTSMASISHTYNSNTLSLNASNFDITGNTSVTGNMDVTGEIHCGKVYNAVYNGFGEIFRKDPLEIIEYGDVVCVREDGLVHKVSSREDIDRVIGVCSNTIGLELGGNGIDVSERVEVELVGQIWVKTDKKSITPGQMLRVTSYGKVTTTKNRNNRFGIALTNVIDGKVRVLYNG